VLGTELSLFSLAYLFLLREDIIGQRFLSVLLRKVNVTGVGGGLHFQRVSLCTEGQRSREISSENRVREREKKKQNRYFDEGSERVKGEEEKRRERFQGCPGELNHR
jgi:hypothetical protein